MKDMAVVGTALFAEVVRDYFDEYTDYRVRAFSCHAQFKGQDTLFTLRALRTARSFVH